MKLKISHISPLSEAAVQPKKCTACGGSGWYDWTNPRTGRQPKCDACAGTGAEVGD